MFDQNDQSQQAASPTAQPTGIQNTTTPDLSATAPAVDMSGSTATPPSAPAPDTSSMTTSTPMPDATSAPTPPADTTNTAGPVDLTATPDATSSTALSAPSETPLDPTASAPTADTTASSADNDLSGISMPDLSTPTSTSAPSTSTGGDDSLLSIKKDALQNLTPLLDHLDQSPEEKFRTTMMLIQASDDKSLVQAAYNAAQKITDEKEKAQALLDIVNEINYFTQSAEDKAPADATK